MSATLPKIFKKKGHHSFPTKKNKQTVVNFLSID